MLVDKIVTAIKIAGGVPYLVGGYVRDKLLGIESKDIDIEVYGLSMEQLQWALWDHKLTLVGESFGVLHVDGIDISLPRGDTKVSEGHSGFEVTFDPAMGKKEACRRRDFTMNSIMLNPDTHHLTDHHGGKFDIENKIIRHIDDEHFGEDPLRALRAVQFAVRFGMTIAPETAKLCAEMDMSELPKERIWEEMFKFLTKGKHFESHGIEALDATNMWRIFPELAEMWLTEQDPEWHPEGDVLTHTFICLDWAAKNLEFKDDAHKFKIMLGILLHDVGKSTTFAQDGTSGRVTAKGHAKEGADIARDFLSRFTTEAELIEDIPKLVYNHMVLYDPNIKNPALRRLSTRVGNIGDLLLVCEADCRHETPPKLLDRINNLSIFDGQPERLVQYSDLGVEISPPQQRGIVVKELYEAQLDGLFTTKEEGVDHYFTYYSMDK